LAGKTDRNAHFKTVISLLMDGKESFFEGVCEGRITSEKRGISGFGYDPVFIPTGSVRTFAEMNIEEKNNFSHRRKATQKLVTFLNNLITNP
jgi:XTP/dITP diphosphohydrolase